MSQTFAGEKSQADLEPEITDLAEVSTGSGEDTATGADQLLVEHRAGMAVALAAAAALLAAGFLVRALLEGAPANWVLAVVLAVIALVELQVIRDASAPLLVADDHGIRLRSGERWHGLPWDDLALVELTERTHWWRDGAINVIGDDEQFGVRLAATTKVNASSVAAALEALAGDRCEVRRIGAEAQEDEAVQPTGFATLPAVSAVEPERASRSAVRAESVREFVRRTAAPPQAAETSTADLDEPNHDEPGTDEPGPARAVVVQTLPRTPGSARAVAEPALVGLQITAARTRAGLAVEGLSERTHIRPHVIERIEADDFAACGGDFYARGHLRTIARVLGLDGEALVRSFDDGYAGAPVEARQVFEAELATGTAGGLRAALSGPRWSVVAASVVGLALVWGAAQAITAGPEEVRSPTPEVADTAVETAELSAASAPDVAATSLAPIEVRAAGQPSQVVIRDRDGLVLWAGRLARGEKRSVIGLAPFEVTASRSDVVQVRFLRKNRGSVGETDQAGSKQYG